MDFHDGIGAIELQTAKGTSPADNINNGALGRLPIAKRKDAVIILESYSGRI